jgi:hypothetical protein
MAQRLRAVARKILGMWMSLQARAPRFVLYIYIYIQMTSHLRAQILATK